MGVRVAVEYFFFDQSVGIDETDKFQVNFFLALKLWAPSFGRVVGVRVGVA